LRADPPPDFTKALKIALIDRKIERQREARRRKRQQTTGAMTILAGSSAAIMTPTVTSTAFLKIESY
jgi:hypothetical protein